MRIHLFGASGSGTTTLGKVLAGTLGLPHFDTDDYFWIRTEPPFQTIRERTERQELLRRDLERNDSWVLSGSLCGWGDFAMPLFDLAVYLWLPADVRMRRLRNREVDRYGPGIEKPDHPLHQKHAEFLDWAAAYDTGGLYMRSKSSHEQWMTLLTCPIVRIEQAGTMDENLKIVLDELGKAITGAGLRIPVPFS